MEMKKIKELKTGEYFTLKPVEYPKEGVVWVRGNYEHSCKKYSVHKWSDICHESFMKGNRNVYVDFTF